MKAFNTFKYAMWLLILVIPQAGNTQEKPVKADSAVGIRSGDIVFQTSNSGQSKAIQMATSSIYSHVGIVFIEEGDTLILEAIQPVSLTPIETWIKRGDQGLFHIKRFNRPISEETLDSMLTIGKGFLGKDYDIQFKWTDQKMYCSELVYKIYSLSLGVELCSLRQLRSYNLNPVYVQDQLKKRYGVALPLDEKMVSPGDLYKSSYLIDVEF